MHVLVTLATVCALLGTALAAPLDAWLLKMKAGLSLELRPRADGGHGSEAFVRSAGGAGVKGGAAVASIPSSLILTKNTAEATFGADLVAEIVGRGGQWPRRVRWPVAVLQARRGVAPGGVRPKGGN